MDAELIYTTKMNSLIFIQHFFLWSFKVIYMLSGKRRELGKPEIHSRKNKALFEKSLAMSQKISTVFLVHLMNSCILHFSLYLWEVIVSILR